MRCSSVAPIYRNVPSIGDRVGDISEWGYAICEPSDDVVQLVSRRPRFDNLGDPWLPVVVIGPHLGRRPGWMLCRRLELDEPCVDPSSIPVRPADG